MPTYHYRALNRGGTKIRGEISAPDEHAARNAVREQGLFVVSMGLETQKFQIPKFLQGSETSSARVPQRDLVFFTRQLSTLIRSGFKLDSALNAISEQVAHPRFHEAIIDIDRQVKEGKTLYEALSVYPYIFSETYRSLVKAGEASGQLHPILGKLAIYLEDQRRLKNKVLATLTYPAIMILASIGVVAVLMAYVVPNITSVLTAQNKELPFITTVLIDSSSFLASWWHVILGAIGLALLTLRQYYRSKGGRRVLDRLFLSLPVLGSLFTKVAISRFSSTFAVLLRSGVEILKSLQIVKDVAGNVILAQALEKASQNVGEGSSLAGPLAESGVFPPIVIKMIESGQKSSNLELMLETIAEDYENEVENTILGLTSILEPLIILVMGGFVCFIVVAILVPLQDMANI
jgi:general secretion pathway protein F